MLAPWGFSDPRQRAVCKEGYMAFLHALGGVFGLMLMGFVGFMLAARNWFGAETRIVLPRLITQIALPPFLMYTIMHSFHRNELLMLARGALLPLGSDVAQTMDAALKGWVAGGPTEGDDVLRGLGHERASLFSEKCQLVGSDCGD